jgi:hypothetical protein
LGQEFKPSAAKALKKLERSIQERVMAALALSGINDLTCLADSFPVITKSAEESLLVNHKQARTYLKSFGVV